jgi:hypothetical protein
MLISRDMYVSYSCQNCNAKVDNSIEFCPKCGTKLSEYTLIRDYDSEIDEELFKLEHPVRARLNKFIGPYFEHLMNVLELDVAIDESVQAKADEVRKAEGRLQYYWWKSKRFLLFSLFALLYIVLWVVPVIAFFGDELMYGWIWLGVFSIFPLYLASLWLMVSQDIRDIPLRIKILHSLLGAFNKLVFSILYVVGFFFLTSTVINFLFSFIE